MNSVFSSTGAAGSATTATGAGLGAGALRMTSMKYASAPPSASNRIAAAATNTSGLVALFWTGIVVVAAGISVGLAAGLATGAVVVLTWTVSCFSAEAPVACVPRKTSV